jgi:hypothetical protein
LRPQAGTSTWGFFICLIREGQDKGEIAKPQQPNKINVQGNDIKPKTLTDIGITRKQSNQYTTKVRTFDFSKTVK